MKFQKIFRGQMILMGLGGALVLANSSYAQQEVDPTFFDATPQAYQAAIVAPGQDFEKQTAMVANAAAPIAMRGAGAVQWTPLDENGTIFLVVGIGSVVLLGMAEAVRGSRRQAIRDRAIRGFLPNATAN
jgi:hypothetical protein